MTPISGDHKGGENVTIEGKGFGTDMNNVKVYIGQNKCEVNSLTDDKLICLTSANQEKTNNQLGKNVVVLKGSKKIENH